MHKQLFKVHEMCGAWSCMQTCSNLHRKTCTKISNSWSPDTPPPPIPEKSHPPFSQQPLPKNWDPAKPTLYEDLDGGSTPQL